LRVAHQILKEAAKTEHAIISAAERRRVAIAHIEIARIPTVHARLERIPRAIPQAGHELVRTARRNAATTLAAIVAPPCLAENLVADSGRHDFSAMLYSATMDFTPSEAVTLMRSQLIA